MRYLDSQIHGDQGLGRDGKEELLFDGYTVFVEGDGKVLGIDSGDGYPTL